MGNPRYRDALPASILVLIGGFFLFEARSMSTFGAVFPMLAGGGMMLGGLALFARTLMFELEAHRPNGTFGRPLLLLLALLLWALALPVLGFALSSTVAALLVILIATQERPSAKTLALQVIGVVILIAVITVVFGTLLKVQLP